jgi:hypothetical protein
LPLAAQLLDPFGILDDSSSEVGVLDDVLYGSVGIDEPIERLNRTTDAYFYPGDLFFCIDNQQADEREKWSSLPLHEFDRLSLMEFRMTEPVLEELLGIVTPFLEPNRPHNPSMRAYTIKEKLLVTLNFLGHCHTLRQAPRLSLYEATSMCKNTPTLKNNHL